MKLPRFVTAFPDRHGVVRLRFRRKGLPSHYLIAPIGTAAFEAEYQRCFTGEKLPTRYALAKEQRRRRASNLREQVYFIGADEGPIKIGRSARPVARLATLQTAHATELRLLAVVPGGAQVERAYHRQFAQLRQRGEWFARAPELDAEISRVSNRCSGVV